MRTSEVRVGIAAICDNQQVLVAFTGSKAIKKQYLREELNTRNPVQFSSQTITR